VAAVDLTLDRDREPDQEEAMAEPVRARRLTDEEGRRLVRIVRRARHESIRVRRATIILASSSGTPVSAIARLVAADEDTVRDVIRAFNERGWLRWTLGGRSSPPDQ
jgi:hypothetical protein